MTDQINQSDWVMVPREPTEAMLRAAVAVVPTWDDPTSRNKWAAMIAAAPEPVGLTHFTITCEVDADGTTHTKINLKGYSIVEAEKMLRATQDALREEHWAMLERHFPHDIEQLPRPCHLHEGLVIRVRDKNPQWKPPNRFKGGA